MNEVLDSVISGQKHRTCLSNDEITLYASGRLTRNEQYGIERHFAECDLCRDAVEGAQLLSRAHIEQHSSSLSHRLTHRLTPRRRRAVPGWAYGLAAAAAILIFWGIGLYDPPDKYEQLFRAEFRPYSSIVPQVRGESRSSVIRTALSHYELESYDPAIHELEAVVAREPDNDLAHFYLGNALLAQGRTASAVEHLRVASNTGNDKIEEPAHWYLALAYIRQGNEAAAVPILQSLSASTGAFSARADGILKRLSE